MQLFYQPNFSQGIFELTEEDSKHAIKVLRMKLYDRLTVTDGLGTFYHCEIDNPNPKKCGVKVNDKEFIEPNPAFRHIAIAPTKNMDRLEWFVEKATEFGVDKISLLKCDNSERKVVKVERLRKKAVSAMKQSLKAHAPQIEEMINFKEILSIHCDHKFIAHVDNTNSAFLKDLCAPKGHHLVLIGPEGDFSNSEVEQALASGFKKVSLGQSRLRTETAGVAAVHLLNL